MKKKIAALTLLATFIFTSIAFAYTVEENYIKNTQSENGLKELAAVDQPQLSKFDQNNSGQFLSKAGVEAAIALPLKSDHFDDRSELHTTTYPTDPAVNNSYSDVGVEINKIPEKVSNGEPSSPIEPTIDYEGNNKLEENLEESPFEDEKLSKSEFDLLARLVRAEAQTEPLEGKIAVACVVLNRVNSSQFPDTIKSVIYERGQFQPVANNQINKPADEESIQAVHEALSDHNHIAEDSLFFYNPKIATSRWLDSRQTTAVIGNHVFKK